MSRVIPVHPAMWEQMKQERDLARRLAVELERERDQARQQAEALLGWGEQWRRFAIMKLGCYNSEQLAGMPDHNPPGYPGRNAEE